MNPWSAIALAGIWIGVGIACAGPWESATSGKPIIAFCALAASFFVILRSKE